MASTYFPETMTCPVGGERFSHMALGSISRWGALPDGMPIGSGTFPVQPPQCPRNGLVLYRDFTPAEVKLLATLVKGTEYKALRAARETPYYLAYRQAQALGDADRLWFLLSATWEAKNADPAGERARRYNTEFVAAVLAMPADATSFDAIALRARAANALRELGRFDEAEAVRAAIVIAPDAGGADAQAAQNRDGWARYLSSLAAPISRGEAERAPIDMSGAEEAVSRCTGKEAAQSFGYVAPPPLTAFETAHCARPELADQIAKRRESLRDRARKPDIGGSPTPPAVSE